MEEEEEEEEEDTEKKLKSNFYGKSKQEKAYSRRLNKDKVIFMVVMNSQRKCIL